MSTYYTVLGLSPQATAADIRQAYRRLVLLTHPDRTPDPAAHSRYLAVNEAYETLSNEARRRAYDARLAQPVAPPAPTPQAPPPQQGPARRRGSRPAAYTRRAAPTYDLRPYVRPVRWLVWGLSALAVLVMLDYFVLHYTTTVGFLSFQASTEVNSLVSYTIATTRGSFATPVEVPLDTAYFRVRTSWIFRFILEAWLPDGTPLPIRQSIGSLHFFSGLLLLLALPAQWPRLPLPIRINLAVAATIVGVIVLLMALL